MSNKTLHILRAVYDRVDFIFLLLGRIHGDAYARYKKETGK